MTAPIRNGVVDGDQLGAVRKGGFDLHVVDHLGDTVHHVVARQQGAAEIHQLGHAAAIARALQDGAADIGHRFRVVELQAPGLAPLGQQAGGEQQQLVFLSWGQLHGVFLV